MAKSKYIQWNKADYRAGFTPTPNFGVSLQSKRGFTPLFLHNSMLSSNKNDRLVSMFFNSRRERAGFTLMEIIVATALFSVVALAMLSLFNSTLKINRKSEALRQATQGVRNFTEFLVKTIRNGQIDYSVDSANFLVKNPVSPCPKPNPIVGNPHNGSNTYNSRENRLGIITPDSERWCLFLGDANGNFVPSGFTGQTLVLKTESGFTQILNPPYYQVENLMFIIRPQEDPYYKGSGGLIRTQPAISLFMKVVAKLPSGETFPIYYQTSVSSDKYDIPNN